MTRRHRSAGTALVAVVALLAVCASATGAGAAGSTGDDAGTGSKVTSKPSVVRGVTPTTIKVGGLGTTQLFGNADIGAKARFQRANAEGGAFGRTFDYIGFRDDQGLAATNQQVATQLVSTDKVFAIVPVVTVDLAASTALAQQQVPYAGWAISSNFCGNQYGYSFTGCLFPPGRRITSNAWGTLVRKAVQQIPSPTAVILVENTPLGTDVLPSLTSGVESAGIHVVSAQPSLPVPPVDDYAPLAQAVLTANAGKAPDAVFAVGSSSNLVLLQRALRVGGYLGIFTDTDEYGPELVTSSIGTSVALPTAPVEAAAKTPAMQRLVADVQAVAPGVPIDQSILAGYFAADLFVTAVERAGKNLTVERFQAKANDKFTYKLAGTVGPTTFPAAHNAPTPCGSLVRSDGLAYLEVVPYSCGKIVKVKR
jgi:ABC-type branched-subunit amino acid transport system substrate-binding protein